MLQRSVLTGLVLFMAISGCATVSVIPGTSSTQASITQEQSAVRQASLSFSQTAATRGWISESRGFFDLARVLVAGQKDERADTPATYGDLIGADLRMAEDVEATIITDANDAAAALTIVSLEVESFLAAHSDREPTQTLRGDLVSFERVLVQAQQTRRSFIEAGEIAGISDAPDIRVALTHFDREIDRARKLADRMAREYSRRDTSEAVS